MGCSLMCVLPQMHVMWYVFLSVVKVSQKLEQQKRQRTLSKDREHSGRDPGQKDQGPKPADPQVVLPQSDAILSCPACMATLCIDCQR